MSATNYPPLLDPLRTVPAPLSLNARQRITDHLRQTKALVPREFLALCNCVLNPTALEDLLLTDLENLGQHAAVATLGIRDWIARGGHPTPSSSSANSTHSSGEKSPYMLAHRSSQASRLAKVRDHNACLLTHRQLGLHAAHIFPYSAGPTGNARPNLMRLLQMFVGEGVAERITAYLLSSPENSVRTRINRLENLLTLAPSEHMLWDRCLIVLEPIGDPLSIFETNPNALLTRYTVRFSCLSKNVANPTAPGAVPDLTQVLDPGTPLSHAQDPDIQSAWVFDASRGRLLQDGDEIVLETEDATRYPLPHPHLLILHAALARLVRCAAAASPEEDEWEYSSQGEPLDYIDGVLGTPKQMDDTKTNPVYTTCQLHQQAPEDRSWITVRYLASLPESIAEFLPPAACAQSAQAMEADDRAQCTPQRPPSLPTNCTLPPQEVHLFSPDSCTHNPAYPRPHLRRANTMSPHV
ncbi:hypothetical protein BDZ91DRAFT_739319 [Kalaharituber pfeilii]|nr:hypothetical protein BDZ91DRAFT_739319 [Kalaharituber pfeilii]